MTVNFDVFFALPGQLVESVTLTKVNQLTGAETSYRGVSAVGRAVAETVIDPSGVQTVVSRTTWHLRASSLPRGVRPDRGDLLVSTSASLAGTYVLSSADLLSRGTRWQCQSAQRLLAP